MVAQLVENFVHFERGKNGLDEYGGANGSARYTNVFLSENENVVPKARFEMALHLGQIEVWTGSLLQKSLRVVEEIQAEVEQRRRHRFAVDGSILFDQMPTTGTNQKHGRTRA